MKAVSAQTLGEQTFPVLPHCVTNCAELCHGVGMTYHSRFTGCPSVPLQAVCLWVALAHQSCQQVQAGVSDVKTHVLPELTCILLLYLTHVQKNSRSFKTCRNGDAKGSRLCSLLLP